MVSSLLVTDRKGGKFEDEIILTEQVYIINKYKFMNVLWEGNVPSDSYLSSGHTLNCGAMCCCMRGWDGVLSGAASWRASFRAAFLQSTVAECSIWHGQLSSSLQYFTMITEQEVKEDDAAVWQTAYVCGTGVKHIC